jgi:hypothetical protein
LGDIFSIFAVRTSSFDGSFTCGQIGPHEHHKDLDNFLGLQQVNKTIIVCESFQKYRSLENAELISLEYIGVVKRFAQERSLEIVFQPSASGKLKKSTFVRMNNVKALGLWSPGHVHAMDAYGHLLYYMIHSQGVGANIRYDLLRKGWK